MTFNDLPIKYPVNNNESAPSGPEWKVYFDGGFWGAHGRERPGTEIPIGKRFLWDGDVFFVPAVYACNKGLVIDFCVQAPAARLRSFMEKWKLPAENNGTQLSEEQQMLINADNPLFISVSPKVTVNGKFLPGYRGTSVFWNPCFHALNRPASEDVIRHYSLDSADGWVIWRYSFPWVTKHKPKLKSLSAALMQNPIAMPGPHFRASMPGTRISFTHPATGTQHTLTVLDFERKVMVHSPMISTNQELPSHYTFMSYTLTPDLPDGAIAVTDSVRSDPPRQKRPNPRKPGSSVSMYAGTDIIGIAHAPAAIYVGDNSPSRRHAACSALHFEPADDIEWRLVFYEKKHEDITLALL